jgi:hypothetical protein
MTRGGGQVHEPGCTGSTALLVLAPYDDRRRRNGKRGALDSTAPAGGSSFRHAFDADDDLIGLRRPTHP